MPTIGAPQFGQDFARLEMKCPQSVHLIKVRGVFLVCVEFIDGFSSTSDTPESVSASTFALFAYLDKLIRIEYENF
jgi:hypothetical protein